MPELTDVRNPRYNHMGTIDCERDHPIFGWIPFTASPDDVEEHGRAIHAAIIASGMPIAPYVPPEPQPDPVPPVISRFQARAALMDAGLLAEAELAIADAGPLAQLAWAEATEWHRNSPTIAAIGAELGLTDAQMDDLFRAAVLIAA